MASLAVPPLYQRTRDPLFVFPPYFGWVVVPVASILLLGPHPWLGLLSLAVLVLGVGLLWRPNEIPSLLFFFAWQWIQTSINLARAFFSGSTVSQLAEMPGENEAAIALTLLGLLAIVAGLRITIGRSIATASVLVREQVLAVSLRKWIIAYFVSMVISLVAIEVSNFAPGLAQPLAVIASLKWAFFLTLTYAVFASTRGYRLVWLAIFGFEFVLSLGGFFSSFRLVFLFAFLGILGAAPRMNGKQVFLLITIASVAIFLGTVWTAIKIDYREYVNQGTRSQTILVGRSAQLERMVTLATELSDDDIAASLTALADRISYTQFFGSTLTYVPSVRPHADGALTASGISRPFMPRIFFPDKPPIDESLHTNEYTGMGVTGIEQGTQISIGYFGDAYIDYGKVGMMFALFILGCMFGLYYRWMTTTSDAKGIVGGAAAAVLLVQSADIGFGGEKLLGGVVIWIFMTIVLAVTILPRLRLWLGLSQRGNYLHQTGANSRIVGR
ncbi:hypothetical protein GRI62_07165 [Erythrobacter arachoides]|uniref:Oligosaccharide repeat unit polymerase n=1 Tax=Aurantiacibacter arachoides TaxID=1850444 RepID=A0A844ZYY8_9SPHN|nr:hypothetical protein [Aurantiacibacter arachoides]MXO93383.1 hypothetical protein [Aurantiacibacter arachoides]GGD49779.1 hypothetical protein GCM10011411_06990 [Aurantiacibacter arachoides]